MIELSQKIRSEEKALKNFGNIKKSIKGLYEILNVNLANNDIYLEMGKDNIMALYKNLIELLLNDNGQKELARKISNSEIDLDIVLDEYIPEKFK